MNAKQAKYPQLRFKGFTDPWEKRRLGERFYERADRSGDGEMLSVTIANGVVLANSLDRKDNSSSDKSNYKVVKKDDIAYNSMRMWQAASGVSKYDGIVSPAYTVLVPANGESSTFFGYQFKKTEMKQIFQRNSQGLTSDTWNLKYPLLSRIKTSAPEKTEQIKIGEFLNKLDNLIAVNQRKLAKLKKLKQGYLQKLFPKNGSKFPQLRFAGFADAWEQRKLGEVVEFYSGLTYSPENVQYNGTFVLRSSNVKNGEIVDADNVYVSHEVVNSDNVKEGDVIVVVRNGSRNLIGKHAQIKRQMDNTVIGAFMTGVRSEVPDFTNTILDTQQFAVEINKNLGATINQITTGAFKKMQFTVPKNKDEREVIGTFFRNIDDTITLHQRKLEKLQELKKGYLQKMFC